MKRWYVSPPETRILYPVLEKNAHTQVTACLNEKTFTLHSEYSIIGISKEKEQVEGDVEHLYLRLES